MKVKASAGIIVAISLLLPLLAQARDFDAIKKSGALRVLTVYSAEPEALPRDFSPEDYETSLLESFANQEGLNLEFVTVPSFEALLAGLGSDQGDLAAAMLTITPERQKRASFTRPFLYSSEQLVTASSNKSFKGLGSLAGHSVHVQPGTSYEKTAEALARQVKGLAVERTPDRVEQDDIFLKVTSGEYEYSVADESYVRSFLGYNDGVRDVYTFPGRRQIAWALPKDSPKLLAALDAFIRKTVPVHQLRTYKEDLPQLKRRGYIRFLTRNNPYTYYIQNGVLMGFEYELAREFAKRQGLHPVFVVPPDWGDLVPWLLAGRGELVAACVSVTPARSAVAGVAFGAPYCSIKEQLVGRKAEPVKTLRDLAGRRLAVRKSSSYWERAQNLKDAGVAFTLVAVPDDLETFEILDQIEAGVYDLTLCDDNIAAVELKTRPKLAALLTLPGEKNYAWMVRSATPALKAEVDRFFTKERKSTFFNVVYGKYFKHDNAASLARAAESDEDRLKFMPYRKLIAKYSQVYGFHWCLIAAQILQESRFNPDIVSASGAVGLMQVMRRSAEQMGFSRVQEPEQNIHAGTKYLDMLRDKPMFSGLAPFDQLCFALASYNGGLGHLLDARRLAAREKLDPDRWLDNVEKAYGLLAQERHSRQAKYGSCRTAEIIGYVRNIIFYYRMYLREQEANQPGNKLPRDAMP